jgi:hypothetical protein
MLGSRDSRNSASAKGRLASRPTPSRWSASGGLAKRAQVLDQGQPHGFVHIVIASDARLRYEPHERLRARIPDRFEDLALLVEGVILGALGGAVSWRLSLVAPAQPVVSLNISSARARAAGDGFCFPSKLENFFVLAAASQSKTSQASARRWSIEPRCR